MCTVGAGVADTEGATVALALLHGLYPKTLKKALF